MEVRDLWPESIKAVSAMNQNWILAFFELLEKCEKCIGVHGRS